MPFQFGGPDMPMSLRWTRSLVFSEVVLLGFVVISYVIFTILGLEGNNANGNTTVISGSSWAILIAVALLAVVLVYLAVDLRNRRNSTRMVLSFIQVVILVFGIVTSLSNPLTIALIVLLTCGALYSLYAPASNVAFAQGATAAAAGPKEVELPEELKKLFAEAEAKKAQEASPTDEGATDDSKDEGGSEDN